MAYPFFNGVEANKINPALDDLEFDTVLDEFKADRMCTQIVRDFQAAGYTHVDDTELDELVPIQHYIDQVEAVTQSNIDFYKRNKA
jgi:hypothetical protein